MSKKIVKSSFQMSTTEAAAHRAACTAPVLSDMAFGIYCKVDGIEKGDRISVRVGTRRKLFRVERVYTETVTYPGDFGYPDDVSFFTRIALLPKPQK